MPKFIPHSKHFIILDSIIILFCIGVIGYLLFAFSTTRSSNISLLTPQISQSPSENPVTSKVWRITFVYNTQTQALSMKDIVIKPGTANASVDTSSPYLLNVLDNTGKTVFTTHVVIAQQILYDVYFPPGSTPSGLPQLQTLTSIVTIPYITEAKTIIVTKNDQTILSFAPPKELSFHVPSLIDKAYAATCSLLHVVFVSDGYTDMTKFHADVQKAEATFTSKAPFSSHTDIFDFKSIDNTKPLGCKQNGMLRVECLYDTSVSSINDLVFSTFPDLPQDNTYTKIVVLVDGGPEPIGNSGGILGVASAIGGQLGVFQDQLYFEPTATMEVLGHDVGQLYDRYLYPPVPGSASDIGKTIPPPALSNCTTNSNGESFWKNAGITTTYKGCTSEYMYAPAPLDCGALGSSKTIMSAANCAGTQFDPVEQYYLTSVILPRYCGSKPTDTPTPTVTPSPTPTITPAVVPQAQTTQSSSMSGAGNSGTIAATPAQNKAQTYSCKLDPNCDANNNLQMCQLKCSPQ